MTPALHSLGLHEPFAARLAAWIHASSPDAARGDLTGALVILPSVRACATLRHELLERAAACAGGQPTAALLLPDLLTPRQLVAQLAARLGLGGALAAAPPDELRALLLASRLRELEWVARHPESAAGLAEELVRTFDEARRARAARLLEAGAPAPEADLGEGHREILAQDLRRLREAFRLYRAVVPADSVDVLAAVAERLGADGSGWPGPTYARVAVAGFSEVDAVTASVLRAALARGEGHVFLAGCDDELSRAFVATFRDPQARSHPLAPGRRLRAALDLAAEAGARTGEDATGSSQAERATGPAPAQPELCACGDPEDESRFVADLVCRELAARGVRARIAVASADRSLARRIAAQLRDAGVDADDTGGQPLASCPAGLLAHFILACAVTELQHGALLEVLSHPFADLFDGRAAHNRRVLLFERMVLRGEAPPLGLDEYRRRAAERDAQYTSLHPNSRGLLTELVDKLALAFAPLLSLPAAAGWGAALAALRQTWSALAPSHPLDPQAADPDVKALAALLEQLQRAAPRLDAGGGPARASIGQIAGALDRLLAATTVRPHRSPLLPVQIMGLLEARLERFELLVVAGLGEEIFPGRIHRPLFLSEPAREAAGLPSWRDALALQTELLLRLLHGGDRVVVSWPRERGGQPALPSPLIERLLLALRAEASLPATVPLWRREAPPLAEIEAAQGAFAREPIEIPVAAASLPLRSASYSGLRAYLDCPYRFLLERGFGLGEEDEVLEAFRKQDYGQIAHACMERFLASGGRGAALLAAGDAAGAAAELRRVASELFGAGAAALPQRRLWQEAFLAAAPAIVQVELERAAAWVPTLLERDFSLPVGALRDWVAAEAARQETTLELPAVDEAAAALLLTGRIDRIDRARAPAGADGARAAAVIDYKSGWIPGQGDVKEGREPQLALYAVAVESGAVPELADERPPVAQAGYYTFATDAGRVLAVRYALDEKSGRGPLLAGARRILEAALGARDRAHAYALLPTWRGPDSRGKPPCPHCPHRGTCRIDERAWPWPGLAPLLAADRRRR